METQFWHKSRAITTLKNNEKLFEIVFIYILSISMHLQNFIKIYQLVRKINIVQSSKSTSCHYQCMYKFDQNPHINSQDI